MAKEVTRPRSNPDFVSQIRRELVLIVEWTQNKSSNFSFFVPILTSIEMLRIIVGYIIAKPQKKIAKNSYESVNLGVI